MTDGWISIYRELQDHWIWKEKPFDRGKAWVDLLLMANHKDAEILFEGNKIIVRRGSLVTSIRKLCKRWGWSNTKVTNFLNVLEKEKMLEKKSLEKATALTIVNYSTYQEVERHRNDSETTVKRLNNNKKENKERFVPPTFEEIHEYLSTKNYTIDIEYFLNFYGSKNWMVGKNKMSDWKRAVGGAKNWDINKRLNQRAQLRNPGNVY